MALANRPDNPLKRLQAELESGLLQRRLIPKSNRTLYLDTRQFKAFKRQCDARGVRPSEVIDMLIALYMEELGDNPPKP